MNSFYFRTKVDMTKYIEEHPFTFDNVFSEAATNDEIYLQCVRPMIEAAFYTNAKVTCFAYGQTGSGKTHTMMGPTTANGQISTPGLYLLSGFDLFNLLSKDEFKSLEVFVSFYEIYCGKLYDLLHDRNLLTAREDGKGNICIAGLSEKQLGNLNDLMKVIDCGLNARTTGVTGANSDSSRSHGIIQICLRAPNGSSHGKISFIDLAGSERAQDTIDTNKQTRLDGAEINKSLLALKECIRALDQDKKHTPFRGSKLTLVLRDSFTGGNCKTLMIANISPSSTCAENTLNTLRYADRVKELKKDRSENLFDKEEDLNKIMMMPRNHCKTVKYAINKNSLKNYKPGSHINQICPSKKSSENLNEYRKGNPYDRIPLSMQNLNPGFLNNKENLQGKEYFSLENSIGDLLNKQKPIESKEQDIKKINLERPSDTISRVSSTASNLNLIQTKPSNNNFEKSLDFINNFSYLTRNESSEVKHVELKHQQDLEANTKKLKELSIAHEKIIERIISEEDDFVTSHRGHVDLMVSHIKKETCLINTVEQSNSDINAYLGGLESELESQIEKITRLKSRIDLFKSMIKEEEGLSRDINELSEKIADARINSDNEGKYSQGNDNTNRRSKNDLSVGLMFDEVMMK